MKFLDQIKIYVKGGDGSSGSASFRREKFVEFGGPDGGDGGNGGSVSLLADPNLNTLVDFRFQQHFKAQRGENGMGNKKSGKSGKDLVLKVPVGTQIFEEDNNTLIEDLKTVGQKIIDPPFPPSPPSGPPNSINFSLLKLEDPDPPSPAFTYIFA